MTVLSNPADFHWDGRQVAIAIGFFDGVHLGHQQVLRQTVADAEQHSGLAVAITFDKHPNTVVAPAHTPPLIQSVPQKLRAIASTGIHATWLIPFDLAFSQKTADVFVRELLDAVHPVRSLCVGSSFAFGFKRTGSVQTLQTLGAALGFVVHGLASIALDGRIVSSTRIRELIRSGNLDTAGQMLGKPYSIAGLIVQGRQMGRALGFPTANIDTSGRVLPPNGVYAAQARVGATSHRAVVNIGSRPTFQTGDTSISVEAHLLDFDGTLYGQEMELTIASRIRAELVFPSKETLQAQIQNDITQARSIL